MTTSGPRRHLPAHPSAENLRKQAKTLAKRSGVQLAKAQHQLAADYGFRSWAALMRTMRQRRPDTRSALVVAAARADVAAVQALLEQGSAPGGSTDDSTTPLWEACASSGPAAQRIAVAHLLLDAGASPRHTGMRNAETPLHAAARTGPLALVELLIRRGALLWQRDRSGKTPLDYARNAAGLDRDAIVELLDRPVIRNGEFRAAVQAIHAGDSAGLARLLDQHPRLLRERAAEPECLPRDYFRDPKLFWFIANNPTLMVKMPANIAAITRIMLERGVDQADLDYALELVISNRDDIMDGHQAELLQLLLEAGAKPSAQSIAMGLAHGQLGPIRALLEAGLAMTAPIAAALDLQEDLARLLPGAPREELQAAFGLAVINRRLEAARLCLEAGADANAYLPVHKHSQPLHQAVLHDDEYLLQLLVQAGASLEARDTLWDGTPLGWAVHNKKAKAEAYLRSLRSCP